MYKELGKPVKIFRYVTEGTFDSYSWQVIENKHPCTMAWQEAALKRKRLRRGCVKRAGVSMKKVKNLSSIEYQTNINK